MKVKQPAVDVGNRAQRLANTPEPAAAKAPPPQAPTPKAAGWAPKQAASAPSGPVTTMTQAGVEGRLAELNQALVKANTTGVLGTKVANLLTGGALASAAKARDQVVSNTNALHQRLLEKDGGKLSPKSVALLNSAIDGAMDGIKTLADIRSGVVKTTADVGTNMALVAAAPLTGGASLAGVATLGAVGAGTKVALAGSMEGANYSTGQALQDAVSGGAQGAAQGAASMVKVTGAAASVGNAVAARAGLTAGRVAAGATSGALTGAAGGALSAGAGKAAEFQTWRNGVKEGLGTVATAAGKGALSGGAGGAIVGGALNATGRQIEVSTGKPAAAPPKPAVTAEPAKPAVASEPKPAAQPAKPAAPAAAPPPAARVPVNTEQAMKALESGGASVKDSVLLRETYASIRKNAAAGVATPQEMELGLKLKDFFKAPSVSIEGKTYGMSEGFASTASPRMDAAAAAVEKARAQMLSATGPGQKEAQGAFMKAVDELRNAQREHLAKDGLLSPLFQELDSLQRKVFGPEGVRIADVAQRNQNKAWLDGLKAGLDDMLRSHAGALYGDLS